MLRLAQAVLERERTIRVWACGYNTMLTQSSLGETKPADLRDPATPAPTAGALIRGLLTAYKGRFSWIVCTACSAERGARDHIAEGPAALRRPAGGDGRRGTPRTLYIGGA
ncbi:hypothetical protein GCM10017687_51230 [Streptomyces echinatus]|uniref:hypothetical protein n=1 Tax=Streptomyces echinatus TaxID=67293 RepID=UPI0031E5F9D2